MKCILRRWRKQYHATKVGRLQRHTPLSLQTALAVILDASIQANIPHTPVQWPIHTLRIYLSILIPVGYQYTQTRQQRSQWAVWAMAPHQVLLTQPVELLEFLGHEQLSTTHRAPDLS